jgi:hypothetical protein
MIMIKYKDGDSDNPSTPQKEDSPMPDYLQGLTGGNYYYTIGGEGTGPNASGYLAKLEHPVVVQRLRLLMKAIATRFDNNSTLAAVMFAETANSVKYVASIPTTVINEASYYAGLMKVDKTASCVFKKTPFIQLTNFPGSDTFLNLFFNTYNTNSIGFGGPDVYTNDSSLNSGAYSRYGALAGQLPIAMLVASENYKYDSHENFKLDNDNIEDGSHEHGKTPEQSVTDLADFANESLHANYIFWKRDGGSNPYFQRVRAKALSSGADRLPILGSGLACPTKYQSCSGN